ncbi:MAG: hypothetical protein A2521_04080 [Deltaproteobacteria bacterium RIFOXYD12_FULL_57_12]|nr:MAG: hypothetical protein A2521_04080 [Deltaproteobacteria bacterium RIFOXYD12_FULL_57_12]
MKNEEKRVKDIMSHIGEYDMVDGDAPLCDALAKLKANWEKITAGEKGSFHKTMFVTDASGTIVGKLSFFDIVKGLVPEPAKEVKHSRRFYSILSSRTMEVADEVAEMQRRFTWLHSTFLDLVKQETKKKVRDIMSPIHPLLKEEDSLNKAIFVMFKENIRQPLVSRGDEIIGVVSLMDIFPELLEIAGDECFL